MLHIQGLKTKTIKDTFRSSQTDFFLVSTGPAALGMSPC